jgi:hypothetical protein
MATHNKRSHQAVFSVVERMSAASSYLARTIEIAGNVAGYALWQRAKGMGARRFMSREALWRSTIFPRLSGPVTVLEFGVAGGDATRFWLGAVPNPDLHWDGFDTFTGLPTSWSRGGVEYSPAGRFDAGGATPSIDDPRVTWHIGLVQDTLPGLTLPGGRLCVIVDLDLYEPSAFALNWLADKFRPGDLLYFDEIYDPWHERRALDEFLQAGHRVAALGTTGMSAAYEYLGGPA